ncbi:MAG: glycosyltransferase family 2 protein [Bacteroides sp.]|nr:glycosyltransferase family 2 protein [Bacteroides sp.]MCM1085521.1 glycosyltransferase family 2 protein [Bacteroides sp.]
MISVLIPNYNYDCLQLVRDLHGQLTQCGYPFEIIVVEDGSTQCLESNRQMTELENVRYEERKENVGRFKIRALLPSLARYPYLICMDSDAGVVRSDYIRKYLDFALRGEQAAVVGGKERGTLPDARHSLRFAYECKRECRPGLKRGLSTFNYMVPASVLRQISLDDGWDFNYGHEDTVLGIKIKRLGVPVVFIDNPLVHLGLDTNERMIQKAEESGKNLLSIYHSGKYPELPSESRLLACYLKVRKYGMGGILRFFHRLSKPLLLKNLNGRHPNMKLFDFYRLGEMLSV